MIANTFSSPKQAAGTAIAVFGLGLLSLDGFTLHYGESTDFGVCCMLRITHRDCLNVRNTRHLHGINLNPAGAGWLAFFDMELGW
ncbi:MULTISPECIES: hypothetical protein [unclassified Pseudomonas]|uniref:hypothetical protein n=1 Tax=unclassified Pseudomonas TaxID=196821 RepID=UPI0021147880|nr:MULTISPECIES: hypothetical protein [unclassified Pseudomonas]